ncbi:hypothetical protein T492DRAFT_836730 [Pavlovales sp. CCMP2436]|nr:hypothetical protein T492DRAFT_836730 [Pavlovales sp. CCMP2436]
MLQLLCKHPMLQRLVPLLRPPLPPPEGALPASQPLVITVTASQVLFCIALLLAVRVLRLISRLREVERAAQAPQLSEPSADTDCWVRPSALDDGNDDRSPSGSDTGSFSDSSPTPQRSEHEAPDFAHAQHITPQPGLSLLPRSKRPALDLDFARKLASKEAPCLRAAQPWYPTMARDACSRTQQLATSQQPAVSSACQPARQQFSQTDRRTDRSQPGHSGPAVTAALRHFPPTLPTPPPTSAPERTQRQNPPANPPRARCGLNVDEQIANHKGTIVRMLAAVEGCPGFNGGSGPGSHDELFALRFLLSHKLSYEKGFMRWGSFYPVPFPPRRPPPRCARSSHGASATAAMRTTLEWRLRNGSDKIREFVRHAPQFTFKLSRRVARGAGDYHKCFL